MTSPEIDNAVSQHALSCPAKNDIAEMKTNIALILQRMECVPDMATKIARLEKDRVSFMGTWKGAVTVIGLCFTLFGSVLYFAGEKWVEGVAEAKVESKSLNMEERVADAVLTKLSKYFNINIQ